jgi:hypothetical protein
VVELGTLLFGELVLVPLAALREIDPDTETVFLSSPGERCRRRPTSIEANPATEISAARADPFGGVSTNRARQRASLLPRKREFPPLQASIRRNPPLAH